MDKEVIDCLRDAIYSALDLIKNELGQGKVTAKLECAAKLLKGQENE
jgi:hypothetical protein